jgi:hypothetical protein
MSLLAPTETYFKARRALAIASGILLLALYVGIVPESKEGTLEIFGVRVGSPDSIPFVVAVMVLYCIWQFWASYVIQSHEVRAFSINRIDFGITLLIATFAIGSYIWAVRGDQKATFGSLFIAVLGLIGAIVFFFFSSAVAWRYLRSWTRRKNLSLAKLLSAEPWVLVFNPQAPGGWKKISFEPDGTIGEGRNDNESRWRIQEGFLELLNSSGQIFSRFSYDKLEKIFNHTNDPDTLSLRNQVLKPSPATARAG